jgi:hypothetical protein
MKESLMEQIACNAAHFAVDNWGKHLSKGRQVTLWKRHYDSVLAALMTFEEINNARVVRARAYICEN